VTVVTLFVTEPMHPLTPVNLKSVWFVESISRPVYVHVG